MLSLYVVGYGSPFVFKTFVPQFKDMFRRFVDTSDAPSLLLRLM